MAQGALSDILKATGVNTLRHSDMIASIRTILSDFLVNGKVGWNRSHRDEIEKGLYQKSAQEKKQG